MDDTVNNSQERNLEYWCKRNLNSSVLWLDIGSNLYTLYQYSETLALSPEGLGTRYVGLAEARVVSPETGPASWMQMTRYMLLAMAFESWFKGILIYETVTLEARKIIAEHNAAAAPLFTQSDNDPTVDQLAEFAIASPEIAELNSMYAERLNSLYADLEPSVRDIVSHGHNLPALAKRLGINLSEPERRALTGLMTTIQLGRYPAPQKVESLAEFCSEDLQSEVLESLLRKTHQRFSDARLCANDGPQREDFPAAD